MFYNIILFLHFSFMTSNNASGSLSSVTRSTSLSKPAVASPMFWKDLKQFKQWRKMYFNRWLGTESTQFYMTFPDVVKTGNMKTYAGFWAQRIKRKNNVTFYMSGSYEFIYYKFKGYNERRSPKTFHFYRLRLNGDSSLNQNKTLFLMLRDIEFQQTNFDTNFIRGTLAVGRALYKKFKKKFSFVSGLYIGASGQTNIDQYFPGITNIQEAPHGAGFTGGAEVKWNWKRFTGHIKHQFAVFGANQYFNKTTLRFSIRDLFFQTKDHIWIQLDLEINKRLRFVNGNLIYINYFLRF